MSRFLPYLALAVIVILYLYADSFIGTNLFPQIYLNNEYAFHLRTEHFYKFIVSGLLVSGVAGALVGVIGGETSSKWASFRNSKVITLILFLAPVINTIHTAYFYVNHIYSWMDVLFDLIMLMAFIITFIVYRKIRRDSHG